jgi:hypothetical protein
MWPINGTELRETQQLHTFKYHCPPAIKITNRMLDNEIKITTPYFSDLCIICKEILGRPNRLLSFDT